MPCHPWSGPPRWRRRELVGGSLRGGMESACRASEPPWLQPETSPSFPSPPPLTNRRRRVPLWDGRGILGGWKWMRWRWWVQCCLAGRAPRQDNRRRLGGAWWDGLVVCARLLDLLAAPKLRRLSWVHSKMHSCVLYNTLYMVVAKLDECVICMVSANVSTQTKWSWCGLRSTSPLPGHIFFLTQWYFIVCIEISGTMIFLSSIM
jgi:hypothetical protein